MYAETDGGQDAAQGAGKGEHGCLLPGSLGCVGCWMTRAGCVGCWMARGPELVRGASDACTAAALCIGWTLQPGTGLAALANRIVSVGDRPERTFVPPTVCRDRPELADACAAVEKANGADGRKKLSVLLLVRVRPDDCFIRRLFDSTIV